MKTEEQQFTELALDDIYFRGGGRYNFFSRNELELIAEALRTGDFDKTIREIPYDDPGGAGTITKKVITAKDLLERHDAQMISSLASQLRIRGRDGEITWRTLLPFSTLREFHEALHYRVVEGLAADSISNRNDSKKTRRASPKRSRA